MRERTKFMAVRTAKVSAIRGEERKVNVAACCDVKIRSSMIQPNPSSAVVEFHAASVKTEHCPERLGFGSNLIKGFGGVEIEGAWAITHFLASARAFWRVSARVKLRFWKTSWFLEIQIDPQIQTARVPASIPI